MKALGGGMSPIDRLYRLISGIFFGISLKLKTSRNFRVPAPH